MEMIDNISKLFGDSLKSTLTSESKLKIAASCFSIYAYEHLKDELEQIESLDFIFTSPTFLARKVTDNVRKEKREFYIPKLSRERSLYGNDFEIKLKNELTQRAIAKECADWIRRKAKFKSNSTSAPIQQFLINESNTSDLFFPLSGFTAVDLGYQKGDAMTSFVHHLTEPTQTKAYVDTFNQLWANKEQLEDVTEAICEHITAVYKENAPQFIYFVMLYNIFHEFLDDMDEDVMPNERTGYQDSLVWQKMYNFQKDAAVGIINKLEKYNGCILADSVGLGKTFTALGVIKYFELRNKSVLVLAPKKLADNWLTYNRNLKTNIFAADRFNYDVLNHTDLQRKSGYSHGTPLSQINWGNYDLCVIDESHNFRNNAAFKDKETRYQALMDHVVKAGVKTKVLMLSATPVNNKFTDLKNQLALAYEGESETLNKKLNTQNDVEKIFAMAQKAFNQWSLLEPEHRTPDKLLSTLSYEFFELLDSVTIARSRKHIQKYYDTTDIGKFPTRLKPISHHCPLTELAHIIGFDEIFDQLTAINMSVYTPISYIFPSRLAKYEELYDTETESKGTFKQQDRESSLKLLMTSGLLKRLESSVHSFRLTLTKLQTRYSMTLKQIERFEKNRYDSVYDYGDDQDREIGEIDEEAIIGKKVKIDLADMDLKSWSADLRTDLHVINCLLAEISGITPEHDFKLQHLKQQIEQKITTPINPGNKKIIVFTAYADTASYLYDQLSPGLLSNAHVHSAKITGSDTPTTTIGKGYDFQSILTLFSPLSKSKAEIMPEEPDEITILFATDCISEGQNLQDCDYLINYDIHWNPVRIIQRFGRVDRIGSQNDVIQLVNYWPDITLDAYINLKARVESRMVIANAAATGDDNVLSPQDPDLAYRKNQLAKLQDEVIDLEEAKAGISITDLGLNDFKMDLMNYVKEHGELDQVPLGMHAVVPSDIATGLEPGCIFALRNVNDEINDTLHNRLHPYYLAYVSLTGEVIIKHNEVKMLLDLLRTACKNRDAPIPELYHAFNTETAEGRQMDKYSELLEASIRSVISVKEESDIDSLFSGGRTSALVDTIEGLNDFELIAFVIIQ